MIPASEIGGTELPVIGHVLRTYLERSATFVYTTLQSHRGFRPIVYARRTRYLDEFPLAEVRELQPPAWIVRRAARRLRAHAAGHRRTYDYLLEKSVTADGCAALHAHFGWAAYDVLPVIRRLGLPLVTTFYGRDLVDPHGANYAELFADGSLFVCEGPTMAAQLAGLGCPPERIRLNRIGINLRDFPFHVRQRARPLVLVQAARLVEKKGVDLTLKAFAAARPKLGPSELWIVGDGPLRAELESLAIGMGLGDTVKFAGMLSHIEYRRLLERTHIAIQPSRTARDGDTEGGAPTVLLEMQASGVPVVATRHADIPFVVADSSDLVEEEDVSGLVAAIVRLADLSEHDWKDRVARARRFVEQHHDALVVGSALEHHYRALISSANGGTRAAA